MRIGIILTGDYSWAGGVYYSLNIIKLLHSISFQKKLKIIVIVNSHTPVELINDLPKENIEISFLDKKPFFYKLFHKITGNRFTADINALNLDVIYPLISYQASHSKLNCKAYYWLYDFQHKFLPELFTAEEIKSRDFTFENIATHCHDVVFSSYDSKSHFEKFFPNSEAVKHVYNFVSLLEKENEEPIDNLFNIPANYFIVCNQFWPHKNHMTVLKALDLVLQKNNAVHIVFTGKHNDERNKTYVDELKTFITNKKLENNITLTGFISRKEQVNLMKNAKAVIQPSFFEGWSTVVEDAKALNKFLIVSDINVNREQINNNVLFFKPEDYFKLADFLLELKGEEPGKSISDYEMNIKASKQELINLFEIK